MVDNGRCTLSGTIHRDTPELKGDIHLEKGFSGALPGTLVFYAAGDLPQYNGPGEVIPSRQEQILNTAGKYLAEDIKVNKIPENYGLISYNQDRVIKIT